MGPRRRGPATVPATTPGTFGFLLGDAANAIHFWPGRGLNSGLASALSLARKMVTTDDPGRPQPIKDQIAQGITAGDQESTDRDTDLVALMERLRRTRARLESRLPGLPDDAMLRTQLQQLSTSTLHTLLVSQAWDSAGVGGDEVGVDWLTPLTESEAPGTDRNRPVPAVA